LISVQKLLWAHIRVCHMLSALFIHLVLLPVKSRSTPVGGPVKSGRRRTKEEHRGLDKRLVWLELVTAWIQ